MLIKLFRISFLPITLLLAGGCGNKQKFQAAVADTTGISGSAVSSLPDSNYAEYSGKLVIPAASIVVISPPAGGILKSILCPAGSYVKSGTTLATIENIEFLKMQQDYLETKSRLSYFTEDLKRQGELTMENASSVKKMQQAQMDYQTCEIKLHSLARQLAITGFIPDSIDADHLSSLISIHAPVSGLIDKISIQAGNSVVPGQTLLVMVRNYNPVISVEIDENQYRHLKIGQMISFFLTDDTLVTYRARVSFIGNQVDPDKHVIKVNALPVGSPHQLIPGMRVRVVLKYLKNMDLR